MAAISRRRFLKTAGAGTALAWLLELGYDVRPARARVRALKTASTTPVQSVCYFCSVGCGLTAYVRDGKLVAVEGDPDNPINQGRLCPKGMATREMALNPQRLTKVLYRAPGATRWEEKTWDWALDRIVQRVKETRDATFEYKNEAGTVVSRTEAIASLGSAILNNEECYAIQKLMRALGLVYIEHQARI